jgi:hypothetical protein
MTEIQEVLSMNREGPWNGDTILNCGGLEIPLLDIQWEATPQDPVEDIKKAIEMIKEKAEYQGTIRLDPIAQEVAEYLFVQKQYIGQHRCVTAEEIALALDLPVQAVRDTNGCVAGILCDLVVICITPAACPEADIYVERYLRGGIGP